MESNKPQLIIIGGTYIKFDFDYTDSNIELIKNSYLKEINPAIKDAFDQKNHFKISIEYEKGSVKTKIIVWGTSIYMSVANYGSFRAGVKEIINDVKTFSSYVIEKIDDDPNINKNNILRTQKRTGLPGRIQELYSKIDRLERDINNLSNNEIQSQLQQIKQEVANMAVVLPPQDSEKFINELNQTYKDNLPPPNNDRVDFLRNKYALKPKDEIDATHMFINQRQ